MRLKEFERERAAGGRRSRVGEEDWRMWVAWALMASSLAVIFALIGGMRPIFSLPAYSLLALGCLVAALSPKLWKFRVNLRQVVLFILFAGYFGWRGLASPYPYLAQLDLFALLACAGLYLATAFGMASQRMRVAMVWVLLLIAVVHAGVGIIQFKDGDNFMLFGFMRADYGVRASGLLICPNHLAGYLEMVLMLGISLTIWGRMPVFQRILCGYLCLVCLVGIALSVSRGGFLSTGGGLLVVLGLSLLVVARARSRQVLVGALVVAVALGAVGFAAWKMAMRSSYIQQRVQGLVNPNNMRFGMWEAGFKQWMTAPALGTGAQTYVVLGRTYRPMAGGTAYFVSKDPIHTHNDYIQALAEYGVVGLGLALLVIGSHAGAGLSAVWKAGGRRARELIHQPSDSLALQIGSVGALATIVLHSMVDFNMHIPGNAMVMAFVLGILASPANERIASADMTRPRRLVPALLLGAVAGLGLFLFPKRIPGEWQAEQARAAVRDGRWSEAALHAKRGLALMDDNPELHHHLGKTRLMQGAAAAQHMPTLADAFHQQATASFLAGLDLFPDDVWRQLYYAQALEFSGQPVAARDAYRKAIALDPNSGQPYEFLGLHYERLGQNRLAMQYYRKALSAGSGGAQFAGQHLRNLQILEKTKR